MLILTRRTGQTLYIGDEITITVLGVQGNQVRIGINAPKHVKIFREELIERLRRQLSGGEADGNVAPAKETELEARIGVNRLADIYLTD